jgi:hypothetical protein
MTTETVQVCQVHGQPDDIVYCPFIRCQLGRVPQWYGNGMPAGTRACTVCDGSGRMLRSDKEKVWLPPDDTPRPFCICRSLERRDA